MKNILTIAIVSLSLAATAQVSNYSFSQSVQTYQYLEDSPDAIISHHNVVDDYVEPSVVTLPFTFNYAGVDYSELRISENGFLWFGDVEMWMISQIHPMTAPQPESLKGIISAMGMDLHPQYSGSDFTRVISGYSGLPGNRVFTVEWYHTSRISTVTDPSTGADEFDFQIRLYETSNDVEIIYGPILLRPIYQSLLQVGLKTQGSDVNMRTTSGTTWNNTLQGTMQSLCLMTPGYKPSVGLSMRWAPQQLSVENPDLPIVTLAPSPASNFIEISGMQSEITNYSIVDMTGRQISSGKTTDSTISVAGLASGTYVMQLDFGDRMTMVKFIKE